jgi:hypothetical protein
VAASPVTAASVTEAPALVVSSSMAAALVAAAPVAMSVYNLFKSIF